jgi:molybdate/tungstate transport system ATP-binding protein
MLRLERVSRRWKDFEINNVSFEVIKGEYFIILGPSGAGKTLLLETIAGIFKPEEGDIWLEEERITDLPPEKREISYIPQNYALFPHLTVYENIAYGMRLRKFSEEEIKREVYELAEVLGIGGLLHREPKTLSGGEQQRVAIARAIAIKPKILLLDEPFSNLDIQMASKLIGEMKRWKKELEFTAIHVTHSFEEALSLGDRVGVMMKGELKQIGAIREVFSTPKSEDVARFLGYENIIEGEARGRTFYVNGIKLELPKEAKGRIRIGLRPEDIILSKKVLESSARNVLKMRVTAIEDLGSVVKVEVESSGIELRAIITRSSLLELGISEGDEIYAVFKSSAIHIF